MSNYRFIRRSLRADWLWLLGIGAFAALIGWYGVSWVVSGTAGRRWVVVFGVVMAYEGGYLWYHLARTTEGSQLSEEIGFANLVTVVRGVLFAATAGFVLVPPTSPMVRWVPGVCYGLGAALDFVDGQVARRTNSESDLGTKLDHSFDTLGFLVAPVVGVVWGRLPVVYLSLSAARYLFRGGEAWRSYRDRPVLPLPESDLRRWLAAVQMVVITGALLPVLPVTIVHPVAIVALVPSLVVFVRDWIAVSRGLPGREE